MGSARAMLLGVGLSLVSMAATAKVEKIREQTLTFPYATPLSVDVRIPQDEVLVEGNEVDPSVFGGGLLGWSFAKDKQQARTRDTAKATELLQAATKDVDFTAAIVAQMQPALADGYFSSLGEVRALVGEAGALKEGEKLPADRLSLTYRYGMTSDYNYLRVILWATLPGDKQPANSFHNFYLYYMRLPETIPMHNSKDRSAVWAALPPERYRAMVAEGMATLGKAFVYDLKATGEVPKGKKMIYHNIVPPLLEEGRTETEIDGMDLGRAKTGTVVVMPKDCMQHKCWSIFDTN